MDEYQMAMEDLFARRPDNVRSLKEIRAILNHWGNPQNAFPVIHVVGTNGKGSVSAKIANVLHRSGYKTALFTSPHLFEYTERIKIGEEEISKQRVLSYYTELLELIEEKGWNPNFFDCTTAFAFRYFKQEQIDVAVIEAGLGGRLDSTNVVSPILTVITTVEMDHIDYLGTTLEAIAYEKSRAIKEGIPVVVGPKACHLQVIDRAKKMRASISFACPTSSDYSMENKAIARKSLEVLAERFSLDEKNINEGLSTELPCRFERQGNLLFDGAHNPGGFAYLVEALRMHYPQKKFRFLIGMGKNKDFEESLRMICPIAQHIHFAASSHPDAASPEKLAEALQKIYPLPFSIESSSYLGMEKAKAALREEEILVICGSFYLIGEIYHAQACKV
ncbi:MAG: Folylpolyglutamate synthase [Chlamydiae bacterium]|nr:Folylpolyglutamate synthase [Chlamydiota bacterium]